MDEHSPPLSPVISKPTFSTVAPLPLRVMARKWHCSPFPPSQVKNGIADISESRSKMVVSLPLPRISIPASNVTVPIKSLFVPDGKITASPTDAAFTAACMSLRLKLFAVISAIVSQLFGCVCRVPCNALISTFGTFPLAPVQTLFAPTITNKYGYSVVTFAQYHPI